MISSNAKQHIAGVSTITLYINSRLSSRQRVIQSETTIHIRNEKQSREEIVANFVKNIEYRLKRRNK